MTDASVPGIGTRQHVENCRGVLPQSLVSIGHQGCGNVAIKRIERHLGRFGRNCVAVHRGAIQRQKTRMAAPKTTLSRVANSAEKSLAGPIEHLCNPPVSSTLPEEVQY